MGYETRYTLEIEGIGTQTEPSVRAERVGHMLVDDLRRGLVDRCKWYEHEDDMRALSARFPNVLFTLCGEGDDPGDLWRKYFRNGGMQVTRATIEYAPFDPTKLDNAAKRRK